MRESVGLSYIIGFIAVFFGIFIVLFSGSLGYSKAFKSKNNIIEIIEEKGSYESATESIGSVLGDIGYRVNSTSKNGCPDEGNLVDSGDYHYCVYCKNQGNGKKVYKVITYMYFDFPIIGSHVEFPASGETKALRGSCES